LRINPVHPEFEISIFHTGLSVSPLKTKNVESFKYARRLST